MDARQIIAGLLLLLCIAGVAYFLAQRRSQPQRPVANAGRSEIERDFARVFSMTGAQGRNQHHDLCYHRLGPCGCHWDLVCYSLLKGNDDGQATQ